MKRGLLLILILIIPIVYGEEITLEVGVSKEVGGYEVLLKNLKSDKAVISSEDETTIIDINEEKEIGFLKVKLIEIILLGDNEGSAKLEVTSIYVCGDGVCGDIEDFENCCVDCGCQGGCADGACQIIGLHECEKDSDCADDNLDTLDRCAGSPRKCSYISTIICDEDEDCDDDNECTLDRCLNNDCFNEQIEGCISGTEGDSVEIEFEEEEEDKEENEEETVIFEKEKGFFSKLLGFFKRFFSR